jgi:cellulose synthase/poly-beta-1,6-N-acetylglucosamine synthase-like glycosyltransferase
VGVRSLSPVVAPVTEAPDYSIVVPVYDEQDAFTALFERLMRLPERLAGRAEVVLVDDGSRDEPRAFVMSSMPTMPRSPFLESCAT